AHVRPLGNKFQIQVGPRFVETTLTYDSFDDTRYTLESFSWKLVVTYRVIRRLGNIAVNFFGRQCGARDANRFFVWRSVVTYRITTTAPVSINAFGRHDDQGP